MHIDEKCVIIKLVGIFDKDKEAGPLETLQKELRFAAVCTAVLDVLAWFISIPFAGIGIAVPLGLLLGSAGMLINLLLLRRTVQNAVYHGKTRDFSGYVLRCLVASAVIACGMYFDWINGLAAILPFLFPKLIFGILVMWDGNQKK